MTINIDKLSRELLEAGLPLIGTRAEGLPVADFSRELTGDEQAQVDAIISNHDPIEIPLPSMEDRLSAIEDAMLAQILGG